ncbi:uncharacterized protein LOC129920508 [Episyrphus balteatus]|uniref:uncharacterized protein LOC129920508 n=1 Tax=Episyrphus balteatus TaxID=286459 RepID=UPI00248523B4|nr:uncharacterized protein LOC129920508 [Episyrphus balteatus]
MSRLCFCYNFQRSLSGSISDEAIQVEFSRFGQGILWIPLFIPSSITIINQICRTNRLLQPQQRHQTMCALNINAFVRSKSSRLIWVAVSHPASNLPPILFNTSANLMQSSINNTWMTSIIYDYAESMCPILMRRFQNMPNCIGRLSIWSKLITSAGMIHFLMDCFFLRRPTPNSLESYFDNLDPPF